MIRALACLTGCILMMLIPCVLAPAAEGELRPAPKPVSEMTKEELRELPILHRFEIPLEKGQALLEDVKDNTFSFNEPAFWWLVSVVQDPELSDDLFEPDEQTAPIPALLALPSSYRGKPVTIEGVYMQVRMIPVPIVALRKDVPMLYECTVRADADPQAAPIAMVLVLENPMPYLEVLDAVRVKGYFYKVRQYHGTRGTSSAPMLVARRLEPVERQVAAPGTGITFSADAALALGGGVLLIMLIAFFFVRRLGRSSAHERHSRPRHHIHLRRPDQPLPSDLFGDGGEESGEKSDDHPRQ